MGEAYIDEKNNYSIHITIHLFLFHSAILNVIFVFAASPSLTLSLHHSLAIIGWLYTQKHMVSQFFSICIKQSPFHIMWKVKYQKYRSPWTIQVGTSLIKKIKMENQKLKHIHFYWNSLAISLPLSFLIDIKAIRCSAKYGNVELWNTI